MKAKETFHPPLLPTVSPEEIIALLKIQRAKGEELLKNSSISPGDLQYWTLFTKEILIKAFGPSREYIESILYSSEDKTKPVYEPESNMEKMRRKSLQMTMQAMENYMEHLFLSRGSPKRELPKEAKDTENTEPKGPPQIPEAASLQQEKKDLAKELSASLPVPGEPTFQKTSQGVANMEKTNERKVVVIPGSDENRKKEVFFFLKKLDLEPLLMEGTDFSAKYEICTEAAFAVTLLTGDDMGFPKGKPEKPKPRPSQDVIFGLGFLMGLLHRPSGCVLYEEGLDLPSGCKGMGLIPCDAEGLWKLLLARAMKMANVNVDLNRAV